MPDTYALDHAMRKMTRSQKIRYTVADYAPETLEDLLRAATSPLVVYGLYSEKTIFGAPCFNWAQRAHHDTVHMQNAWDTSVAGEYRVARRQCLELERLSGTTIANILWCDLWGQTQHMGAYGMFPTDQRAFTWHYYKTGQIAQF